MSGTSSGSPRPLTAQSVVISEPVAYSSTTLTKVRTIAGIGPGTICAYGHVTSSSPVLTSVKAKVLGVNDPPPAPDSTPPPMDPNVQTGVVTGVKWCFLVGHEIPNAPCDASPTANNGQLAVWCFFDDNSHACSSTKFGGQCSNTTNCGDSMTNCPDVLAPKKTV
jgi:hypothetical protein